MVRGNFGGIQNMEIFNMVTVYDLECGEKDCHCIQDQCNTAALAVCKIYPYSYLLYLGRC